MNDGISFVCLCMMAGELKSSYKCRKCVISFVALSGSNGPSLSAGYLRFSSGEFVEEPCISTDAGSSLRNCENWRVLLGTYSPSSLFVH